MDRAMTADPIIIIGASAAGVSAARTLRASGFAEGLVIVDSDPNPPYERPPLSKRILEDSALTAADIPLLSAAEASELRIELRLGRSVTSLSPRGRSVELDDGETISSAGAILVATGGRAVRLPLPGALLPGVHTLRSFADAEALRKDLIRADQVAVIGGGLIGAETAVAIARSGKKVHWIDAAPKPLAHLLPPIVADHLIERHRSRGISLHRDARLHSFVERNGRLAGVAFADGSIIEVQAAVIGVGISPAQNLATAAGLLVSDGIHVDHAQRSSIDGIYAAGDVASLPGPGVRGRVRQQHWRAAEEQGANAARAMLGLEPLPASVDWFWSDQGEHHLEMAGRRGSRSVTRQTAGGLASFEFDDDRLVGVAAVGDMQAVRVGLRLIQGAIALSAADLADPALDLRSLLRR
jgi:3-phenylpropionate/trans-cinnamate dioxygenase ferredoxin reductase subunit